MVVGAKQLITSLWICIKQTLSFLNNNYQYYKYSFFKGR